MSKLHALSTSVKDMVVINRKKFTLVDDDVPRKENYPKGIENKVSIERNEKGTKFCKSALQIFKKAKEQLVIPTQMYFLSFSDQVNFT